MGNFNCLHPRMITDCHGNRRRVRCGKCEACRNMRGLSLTTQCKLESDAHKYCMFVTLTYSNEYLPLVRWFRHEKCVFFSPATERLFKHVRSAGKGPFLDVAHYSQIDPARIPLFYEKFALPSSFNGLIPVLDKVDLQLFIKRLRYYLSKKSNEKIRYFAVGEYGPVHFRPHYHLLLWFDDETTRTYFGEALLKSWTYGRVDYSLSRGKTASYVASYANSLNSISRLHAIKGLSPFVLHSAYLFGSFYQNEAKEVYEYEYTGFAEKFFTDNGRVKQVAPLLAFENRFFPRCINFGETDSTHHLVCYTILKRVYKEYGNLSISKLAPIIFNDSDGWSYTMMQRLTFCGRVNENTIKSILYTSKKFFRLCEQFNISPYCLVRNIEKYWSDKEYYNLKQQLLSQEEFTSTCDRENLCFLLYWYDNFEVPEDCSDVQSSVSFSRPVRDYIQSIGLEPNFFTHSFLSLDKNPMFCEFRSFHRKLANDMVKHKKLNDLNKIFCY